MEGNYAGGLGRDTSRVGARLLHRCARVRGIFGRFRMRSVVPAPTRVGRTFGLGVGKRGRRDRRRGRRIGLSFVGVFSRFITRYDGRGS